MSDKSSRQVYSTETGSRPTKPGAPTPAGAAGKPPRGNRRGGTDSDQRAAGSAHLEPWRSLPPAEQEVRVRREQAGRGGKEVTVATSLVLVRADAAALLASLKRRYGSGGGLRPGRTRAGEPCFDLEVQGDHADRLVADLLAAGYRAKRAGG